MLAGEEKNSPSQPQGIRYLVRLIIAKQSKKTYIQSIFFDFSRCLSLAVRHSSDRVICEMRKYG